MESTPGEVHAEAAGQLGFMLGLPHSGFWLMLAAVALLFLAWRLKVHDMHHDHHDHDDHHDDHDGSHHDEDDEDEHHH